MLNPLTIKILPIEDVCEHNHIEYVDMMSMLSDSNISFGTNDDTLVTQENLNKVVNRELDYGGCDEKVLISLGS
jgi:hypothetical protein